MSMIAAVSSRTRGIAESLLLLACMALFFGCGGADVGEGSGRGRLGGVARERTLIMDCASPTTCGGQMVDYDSFNPFVPGALSRTGFNFLYEPLYFFNAYEQGTELIPWIATGHRFDETFTNLEIDIRRGVEWSDGVPWTAEDLVFTIQMLKENSPDLLYSTDMVQWVAEAVVVDSFTARIVLNMPNPRFLHSYFVHSGDQGVPIVPAHIWRGKDPTTFANFDPSKQWPVVTGPYFLAASDPQQRIWDLRRDWWAAKSGFQQLPQVERLIYLPYMEESKRVQNLISNNLDTSLELRPANIVTVLEQNPKVTTWTGREPPYSYQTWWPISLGFNTLEPPFDDAEIRWAINHAIDRAQLVEVAWQNSGDFTLLPLPDVPQMRPYMDGVADIVKDSGVGVHDSEKTAAILRSKGWERSSENGMWTKSGEPLAIVIDIFSHFQDLAPVLAAQLKRSGFDAKFRMTSDAANRIAQGTARAYMWGNFSSMRDPHFVMRAYHSRYVKPTGASAEQYWRWSNADYDALVDRMGQTATEDREAMLAIFRDMMSIWLQELPSIPLVQWPHRIAHNETYWTNWPSEDNPYINSAYWSRTWLLVLLNLRAVQ